MTINYTTLLGLAQPVTGTETGQWGDVVNDEITSLLEDAVANAATFSVTSGNVTLTTTNGASNQARMSTLIITGTPGTTRNVIAPSQAKIYQVINQSDGAVVIKGSATTGVTIPAGATGTVVWNGSDFVEVNSTSSGRIIKGNLQVTGNLQVDGNTTLGDASGDSVTVNAGTTTYVQGTANGVAYLNGSKVLTTGSALTFDGTTLFNSGNVTLANNRNYQIQNTSGTAQVLLNLGSDNNVYMGQVSSPTAGALFTYGNQQIFYVGASESMRLTSTGLGIGTSSPGYRLQVDGASTSGFVTPIVAKNPSTNAASAVKIGFDAGGTIWGEIGASYNTNDPYMAFFVRAGSEKMRLTDSGNLGIGTSSPSVKLQVEGAANSAPLTLLRLNNSGTTAGGPGIASRISFTAGATALGFIQGSNFASGAAGLQFSGDGTNAQATLDSVGNLGLGVTPSAWVSTWKSMEFGKAGQTIAGFTGADPLFRMGTNLYTNSGGTDVYASTGYRATQYLQYLGAHQWFTAPSGTAGNAISFTQAMTLDTSGNLLVGTTSTTANIQGVTPKVIIQPGSSTGSGLNFYSLQNGAGQYVAIGTQYSSGNANNSAQIQFGIDSAGDTTTYIGFATANGAGSGNFAERARINRLGQFIIGGTSGNSPLHVYGNSSISTSDWYSSTFTQRIQATSGTSVPAALALIARGPGGNPCGVSIHAERSAAGDDYRASMINTITGDTTGASRWAVKNFNPSGSNTTEVFSVYHNGNTIIPVGYLAISTGISYNASADKSIYLGADNDTSVNSNTAFQWRVNVGGSATGQLFRIYNNLRNVGEVQRIEINNAGDFRLTGDNTYRFTNYTYTAFAKFNYPGSGYAAGNDVTEFYVAGAGAADANIQARLRGDTGGLGLRGTLSQSQSFDYAEFFEWADQNPNNEDRVGYSVVLENNKIRMATGADTPDSIIGVISGTAGVVLNAALFEWQGAHLRDDFGRIIYDKVNKVHWVDADGTAHNYTEGEVPDGVVVPESATWRTHNEPRMNPDFDPDMHYTDRDSRPEWGVVGLMGQVRVRKGQPVGSRWIKMRDVTPAVEEWLIR